MTRRIGATFWISVTIWWLASAARTVCADQDAPRPSTIEDRLAVQRAMSTADYYLAKGDATAAVQALEAELAKIDGNRRYLLLLRDAYKSLVTRLLLANKTKDAAKYLRRLRILDPEAAAAIAGTKPAAATDSSQRRARTAATKPDRRGKGDNATGLQFRANVDPNDVDDPFSQAHSYDRQEGTARRELARSLLANAEQAFRNRDFLTARKYYRQAHETDPSVLGGAKKRWAYCKLHFVVRELQNLATSRHSTAQLANEVKLAMQMSPELHSTGRMLLERIAKIGPSGQQTDLSKAVIKVRHHTRGMGGWSIAESRHFVVYHRAEPKFAEQVATVAERVRASVIRRWFGDAFDEWRGKCRIYVHETADDYARATGVSARSPGHSRIELDGTKGTPVSLRIDLHRDRSDLLNAILPHETTHVVLAGQFGKSDIPRWADEGIAVLSEPQERVRRHYDRLDSFRQSGSLFRLGDLLRLEGYPRPARLQSFYAQSVALVGFLVSLKDERTLVRFLRDGLRGGYAAALRRHYGIESVADLEARWQRHLTSTESARVVQR